MSKFAWARSWVLALTVLAVCAATLYPTGRSGGGSSICLVCGIRGLSDFLSNVILFAPFGLVAGIRRGPLVHVVLAGALISSGIELAQVDLISGRDANIGDIVANTLGAALGWAVASLRPWRFGRRASAPPALGFAALTCVVLISALATLRPALLAPPYYLFWTPDYESHEGYRGRVLSTDLGPLHFDRDFVRMEPMEQIRPLLQTEAIRLELILGEAATGIAPVLAVQTRDQEVILLAATGNDLVYRYWGVADELRLDHADVRIPDVFANFVAGDTISLAFEFDNAWYCVTVESRRRCGPSFSVADTWSLLMSPDWTAGQMRAVGMVWLWLVFVPCGFIARTRVTAAAVALAAAAALFLVPPSIGFAPTPWWQLVIVMAGVAGGYVIAGWRFRRRMGQVRFAGTARRRVIGQRIA